jgi:pimeloyl-ACP methyl ester carboxylesterase
MALMGTLTLGKPITVPYTLADMAADVVGLMDTLGMARAHIVGASMGGMIGQTLAMRDPGRLASFTSIFSTTGDRRVPPATPEAMATLLQPAPLERAAYIKHQANTLRVIRGPNFPEEAASDEARAARGFDRGINPAGVARQFAAILASGDRTAALAKVSTPTLVIHGDADPLIHVEGGRLTAAAIKGARLEIIPKMGHSLPEALWPTLVDLIAGHAARHNGAIR